VADRPPVAAALDRVGRGEATAVSTLIRLATIVSPSGGERQRALEVARVMRAAGLSSVAVDSVPNVTGGIPGRSGRALVFVTVLDDLPIIAGFQRRTRAHRSADRVVGPATELQAPVAAMLLAAEALAAARVKPEHDLVFAAVAREETGLQGMEALYRRLGPRAVGFVELMGDGREIFDQAGGAIVWWRVVARGPEGHTMEVALPNVNQAIGRAVDRIFALPDPERHRDRQTAINVGVIRSGEAFNRRPATGWFSLDVRSQDREIVDTIGRKIVGLLADVARETGIALEMVPDLQSLGGRIPGARESLLVRTAVAASRRLGREPTLSDQGCCNMRVAIAGGTPAVGLHGNRGGARGTADEWASIPGMLDAARMVVLLAAGVGGVVASAP
jgi:acetylornithine deacetylase/succinyl-diaminopimelate desuccinylase-like protein